MASDLTDATANFATTIQRLTKRFGERQSLIFARFKFHRRFQQSEEDVLSFVTELRRLASYCRFCTAEHDTVRDRLVAGCSDEKIRERLFQEPDTLTLENAVVLAQTIERATSESKRLSSQQNSQFATSRTNRTGATPQLRAVVRIHLAIVTLPLIDPIHASTAADANIKIGLNVPQVTRHATPATSEATSLTCVAHQSDTILNSVTATLFSWIELKRRKKE